jgi:NAD+ diphosphatase
MRPVWAVTRPELRGAKCIVTRGDEILLVRHTYGDRRRWDVPGGRLHRGEDPADGARREVREETGLEVADLTSLGVLKVPQDFRRDTIHCFRADLDPGAPVVLSLDRSEIREAGWFRRDALPEPTNANVGRILALEIGAQPQSP